MTAPPATDIERLAIDTVRTLSMDAVQTGELRPPRDADGDGAARVHPLPRGHEPRPEGSGVAGPRPLRAQRGPRLDVAVLGAAPVRLRHLAGRPQAVPAVGLDHAGASRARPRPRHAGRRGDDRPARPGLRQRRRHGDGGALPARALRRRGAGPPHVRDLLRRRPHGGHRVGGGVARRPARARAPRLPLRRQLDLARRPDVAELRQRGRHRALRGLRLARADGRRRQRPRRAAGRDQGGAGGGGAPDAHPRQDDHRLAGAEQAGHEQGARLAARRGRGPRSTKEALGWDPGRALPRARRRLRGVQRGREGRRGCTPSGRSATSRGATRTRTAPPEWDAAWARRAAARLRRRAAHDRGTRTRSRRARRARRSWPRSRSSCRRWSAAPRT